MIYDEFKIIDTEEKAYWLGFIAADGNIISKPRFKFRLKISNLFIFRFNYLFR